MIVNIIREEIGQPGEEIQVRLRPHEARIMFHDLLLLQDKTESSLLKELRLSLAHLVGWL